MERQTPTQKGLTLNVLKVRHGKLTSFLAVMLPAQSPAHYEIM